MNDLHAYCLEIATRAKRASADLAVVTGAQKQAWLRASSKRLVECTPALIEANQQDLDAAGGFGLTAAAVDRLRLTPPRIQAMAAALEEIALLAGARRRDHLLVDSAQRPGGAEGPRSPGRGLLHLRIAAERDLRRSGDLRQERQCRHPPRRQGSGPLESRNRRPLVGGRRRGRAAGRRHPTGRHDRSCRRGRVAPHARVDQRGHSPRRREPHPPRERRGPHAGHQAFCRQLPRLRRSHGRSRHGRAADRELEVPAVGRVQRGRVAAGPRRRSRRAAAADRQGPDRARHRDPRRRPDHRALARRQARDRAGLLHRVSRPADLREGG